MSLIISCVFGHGRLLKIIRLRNPVFYTQSDQCLKTTTGNLFGIKDSFYVFFGKAWKVFLLKRCLYTAIFIDYCYNSWVSNCSASLFGFGEEVFYEF